MYTEPKALSLKTLPWLHASDEDYSRLYARVLRGVSYLALAFLIVLTVELVSRSDYTDIPDFFLSTARPGWTTVGVVMLVLLMLDALFGRWFLSMLVAAPVFIIPAFISGQKRLYLSDPLYPTDLAFGRQIMELMPAMVKDRPMAAALVGIGLIVGVLGIAWAARYAWRNFPRMTGKRRIVQVALAAPLLMSFVSLMDYSTFSYVRDRLQVIPMMWDQKENYRHNGFIMAFAFNLPMANVTAPAGYSADALGQIQPPVPAVTTTKQERPDVIMLMSESLWDATRLTNVKLSPDPMPFMRENLAGHVFSPEFGGMTPNVEFEALTGFSNAFLPYGSIPYQQYIRRKMPTLATFFRSQGYAARAIHPYQSWFWNRGEVYKEFGFEEFKSEENLPPMSKRGIFASDDALFREIMEEGDAMEKPFFFFSVTLQGHGPYEPHRYPKNTIRVDGNLPAAEVEALSTYVQGVKESDDSLKMLMDWASKRKRETIIVLWGDHLPPLGPVYTSSGYMPEQVATRKGDVDTMKREHETPLIVWSNKTGPKTDIGTISPAFIPYYLVKLAGFEHPYYTGFLGKVHEKYDIVDRYQLVSTANEPTPDWSRGGKLDPLIRDYRYLQHDMMFGKQYGLGKFFPGQLAVSGPAS
ncbi:phosphoglycerol transferase MdoB-like AlkP superfamily enzyme [Gellertiella hungarica]|uniref:Phosphoglycerol transferase MdoB-like AlkP superfamily enzyme n=1 Tax=Gellertiella hungarica TaxID=1572859 RepID=A0A7W6NKN2_9HYPH|nr:phosphoglycerol transferase MdoB-like AlkP superfamily enzyme [Gellertiella hungarica]